MFGYDSFFFCLESRQEKQTSDNQTSDEKHWPAFLGSNI